MFDLQYILFDGQHKLSNNLDKKSKIAFIDRFLIARSSDLLQNNHKLGPARAIYKAVLMEMKNNIFFHTAKHEIKQLDTNPIKIVFLGSK